MIDTSKIEALGIVLCDDGHGHAFEVKSEEEIGLEALCGQTVKQVDGEAEFVCETCAELMFRWASGGSEGSLTPAAKA